MAEPLNQRGDQQRDYDIALSFAGEDRAYVEAVADADALRQSGTRVFYDKYEEASLWGTDLYQRLDDVYRNQARYCVIFISKHYAGKLWTSHELKSAQARAFQENDEYLLPARFDDTEIPGVSPTTGYVDLTARTPEELARLVLDKLGFAASSRNGVSTRGVEAASAAPRLPKLEPVSFNPYAAATELLEYLDRELDRRCAGLGKVGIAVAKVADEPRCKRRRFTYQGKLVYFLDFSIGDPWGYDRVSFHHGWREPTSTDASNGDARPEWDHDRRQTVYKVLNVGLLNSAAGTELVLTKEELADSLWEEACRIMEQLAPKVSRN